MEYVVYDDDNGGDDDDDAGTPSYTFVDASSARRAFNLALLRVLDAWQMTLHSVGRVGQPPRNAFVIWCRSGSRLQCALAALAMICVAFVWRSPGTSLGTRTR